MKHASLGARAALVIAITIRASAGGAEVAITSCGQAVVNDTGFLTRNLSCTTADSVRLENASLDLRGFTISGNRIYCLWSCEIRGPGTHRGAILDNQVSGRPGRIILDRFTQEGTVLALGGQLIARNMDVSGAETGNGCLVDGNKVIISDSTISSGGTGVCAPKGLRLSNSRVTGNRLDGLRIFGRVNVFDSTIDGNGDNGIVSYFGSAYHPGRLRIDGSAILNNASDGVRYADLLVRITDSVIRGNGLSGMRVSECDPSLPIGVRDSELSANGSDPDCDSGVVCVDIESCDKPRVTKTVCERSHAALGDADDDWGVCSQDGP
ncbi:MAG TPA: right-handed parallel beta-helix repeat-containing protein [Candidatus Limnocylindrales bacterium]|nr:right-handed parallel beta-helix repeat-containing protein [Candidatus Limnocylindrales bacterium]